MPSPAMLRRSYTSNEMLRTAIGPDHHWRNVAPLGAKCRWKIIPGPL